MSLSDSSIAAAGDTDPSVEEEEEEEDPEEEVEEVEEEQEVEDEDEEEEEIEEEEEVEEEEEEEEQEEEEGEEEQEQEDKEENKRAVPDSSPDVHNDRKDSSQHMESKGQEGNLRPVSSITENAEVMPPSSMHSLEEKDAILEASVPLCETLTLKKEEFHPKHETSSHPKSRKNLTSAEDGKSQGLDVDIENAVSLPQSKTFGGCSEPSCNTKSFFCGVKDMDSLTTKSSSDTGKDVTIGLLERDCLVEDADGGQNSTTKIMQLEMDSRDDVKQIKSRRTRSQSPSTEMRDGNKRPTLICDFFAKGWCIRGSSCSFLHIKDPVNNTDQEADGDLVTANQKRELELKEGVRDNVERSRMVNTAVPFTISLEITSLESSKFPLKMCMQNEQEASPRWHRFQEKRKFLLRDSLFPENRVALNASSNYFSTNLSSYSTHAEGMATIRNQHMYNGYPSAVLNHSPNSRLATQFPATSMSLSHRTLTQSGSSLPFSSSYTDKDHHAPGSTFSVSEQEDLPLVSSSSRVPPHSDGYKSKVCSYDWEPSVPFRPSFFITSMSVSSPGDLYDPLRDSIEIPNIGDGTLKASLLIHGPSLQALSQVRTYGDSAVVGKHMSDPIDEKSSVSSHNRIYENEPNKSCVPCERDCLVTETEITSGTYKNYQNGKMGMVQYTFDVKDFTKTEKERAERDTRHHGEGSGHKKKRVDRDKKIKETDVDSQTDGSVQKETKVLRNFRAALVDQVKELLKPSWHEGRLSKDAHIMIVKKSVDKVLSTLEPHQIPTTVDTAKQYVSSCRLKIAKLVDGYVNKYGKS